MNLMLIAAVFTLAVAVHLAQARPHKTTSMKDNKDVLGNQFGQGSLDQSCQISSRPVDRSQYQIIQQDLRAAAQRYGITIQVTCSKTSAAIKTTVKAGSMETTIEYQIQSGTTCRSSGSSGWCGQSQRINVPIGYAFMYVNIGRNCIDVSFLPQCQNQPGGPGGPGNAQDPLDQSCQISSRPVDRSQYQIIQQDLRDAAQRYGITIQVTCSKTSAAIKTTVKAGSMETTIEYQIQKGITCRSSGSSGWCGQSQRINVPIGYAFMYVNIGRNCVDASFLQQCQ